jgi:hypothetical protein
VLKKKRKKKKKKKLSMWPCPEMRSRQDDPLARQLTDDFLTGFGASGGGMGDNGSALLVTGATTTKGFPSSANRGRYPDDSMSSRDRAAVLTLEKSNSRSSAKQEKKKKKIKQKRVQSDIPINST